MYCLIIMCNYIKPLGPFIRYKRRIDLWEFEPGVRWELLVSDDYIMWMRLITELRLDAEDKTMKLKPYCYSTTFTKSKYTVFRGYELTLRKYIGIYLLPHAIT